MTDSPVPFRLRAAPKSDDLGIVVGENLRRMRARRNLSLDGLAVLPIWTWSGRAGWCALHKLSLAGGAAMAYAWHAFVQVPALGKPDTVTRMGNLSFAVLAATLIVVGARRFGRLPASRPTRREPSTRPCG